jgi:O-glycosyl hydrolase
MNRFTVAVLSLLVGASAYATDRKASIDIDDRVQYQHVTGFGGFSPSPTWSYWLGDTEMNKLFGKGDNQLGLNVLRLYIANNKSAWGAGVANAKNAKKNGAFIFASPWSPPASWKSNNNDSNGGELLESHYGDWANFLNDYYDYMKGQGVEIDAVSIQNEPDWTAEYQSCIWTGEKLAKFLREYGSVIKCKIIAPEAIHFTRELHEAILKDDEACKQLDIVGGHFYGWDGSSYPLATQKGKEVWMTEFLINERQQNEGKNINWKDDGFLFARSINDAMLANMSAWVHYSLKRYYGCIGDGQYGTTNNAITKRGYILSQYAKYVSNSTRVRHSLNDASGLLSSSAYISQTGDSTIVMVLNPSGDTFTTTLSLPFNTLGGCQVVTSESMDAQKTLITLEDESYQPEVNIEPYTVNTFIFTKNSERTNRPDIEEENVVSIMTDGYDLYGASCIPAGWRAKSEEGVRKAGSYSLGPRIMGFSAEGLMQYAFYFRTGDAADGYVSYGEEKDYRLQLEPGKYTLSFSTVGWKANPEVTAKVQTTTGTDIASLVATPEHFVSANGSSARITEANDFALDFEITTTGNYVLKWDVAKSSGGFNEALLGNVKLVRRDKDATAIQLTKASSANDVIGIYDIQGRALPRLQNGINIIKHTDGTTTKVMK